MTRFPHNSAPQFGTTVTARPKSNAPQRGYLATAHAVAKMGLRGVEPLTSRLSGVRSNQLSYRPHFGRAKQFTLSASAGQSRADMRGVRTTRCPVRGETHGASV